MSMAACTDLDERLYDKVSDSDYGRQNRRLPPLPVVLMPPFVAMVQVRKKVIKSIVILLLSTFSLPQNVLRMRLVSLLVVPTGTMADAISSCNITHGMLITPVSYLFGVTIS